MQYLYDDWGKLIAIDTADEEASTAYLELAEANPLRYRGYYYDNETGYYYLQSRYYNPEICRFINADVPEIAKVSKSISNGVNIFAYCNNEPINNCDPTGRLVLTSTMVFYGVCVMVLFALAWYYVATMPKAKWSASGLRNWTSNRISPAKYIPLIVFSCIIAFAKQSKLSKKARATDAPSWIKNYPPNRNEKAEAYAKRLLDAKYGKGKWRKGPGSEYNKIVKYARRNLGMK